MIQPPRNSQTFSKMKIKNKAKRDFYNRFYLKDKKRYDYDAVIAEEIDHNKVLDILCRARDFDDDRFTKADKMLIHKLEVVNKIVFNPHDFFFGKIHLKEPALPEIAKLWDINKESLQPLSPLDFGKWVKISFKLKANRATITQYVTTFLKE